MHVILQINCFKLISLLSNSLKARDNDLETSDLFFEGCFQAVMADARGLHKVKLACSFFDQTRLHPSFKPEQAPWSLDQKALAGPWY